MKKIGLLFLIGFIMVIACSAVFGASELPALGDRSSGIVSIRKEYQIGQIFLQQLYKKASIINDPLTQDYIEDLVSRLASSSGFGDKKLTTVLLDNQSVNAFAAPGGIIGVNSGLILHAKNEQELAAVLAHELAHLSQRHFARNIENHKLNQLPLLAALLGSLLVTAAGGGSLGMAAIISSMAGNAGQELRFSREQEAEADRVGVKILYQAGINPQAMPNMLKRLQSMSDYKQPLEFLQTHPVTTNRIADTQGRADQYQTKHFKPENQSFYLAKIRIQSGYASSAKEEILRLKTKIEKNNKDNIDYLHYGLALAYLRQGNFSGANKQLGMILQGDHKNLACKLLKVKLLFAQGKKNDAIGLMRTIYENHPDSFPVIVRYIKALTKMKKFDKARQLLKPLVENRPRDPFVLRQFANVTGKSGNVEEYYEANANYLHLTGKTDEAIAQLEYALSNIRMRYEWRRSIQQLLINLTKDKKAAQALSI